MGWVKNSSGFDIATCRTIIHAILEQIHPPPYFHDMWYQFLQNVNKLFDMKMNYDSQVEAELDNISYQFLEEMTYVRPFFFNFTVLYFDLQVHSQQEIPR